ncbi:MAG TPA: SdrD B-like domain-containing protein [Vicinamibacterales bacterium]|nr:SdrD B-like domain-containing protein [Vicinamibacterales bacterium]
MNFANGIVFEDLNGDGLRDPFAGEMGLEGWTVELWWNGQVLATATTDADGKYMFPNLGNTTYSLCLQSKGGYAQTLPVGGTGCGGSGYTWTFSGTFQQMFPGHFGEMLQ